MTGSQDTTILLHDIRQGRGATVRVIIPAWWCARLGFRLRDSLFPSCAVSKLPNLCVVEWCGAASQASVVNTYRGHSGAVMSLQWSPHQKAFFSSAGCDASVVIWEIGSNHTAPPPRKSPALHIGAAGGDGSVVDGEGPSREEALSLAATPAPSAVTLPGNDNESGVMESVEPSGGVTATPGKRAVKRRRKASEADRDDVTLASLAAEDTEPKEIVFRHAGHRCVIVRDDRVT